MTKRNKPQGTRRRHNVNVNIEHLRYRPSKLTDVRQLARGLAEGHEVAGRSTRERLDVATATMP